MNRRKRKARQARQFRRHAKQFAGSKRERRMLKKLMASFLQFSIAMLQEQAVLPKLINRDFKE